MFAETQPIYAQYGIATFPVTASKVPVIRGYLQTGIKGSRVLATKFPDAPALGFCTNHRNGITVLDVDSKNDRVLAHALDRHGQTPLIARTGSGKFHAYYRYNGERRRIRPWAGLEIDLLGSGGMVVAPPSHIDAGEYQFIEGEIADVARLPVLQNLNVRSNPVRAGARNNSLWRHCMRHAHHVDSFDDLLDVARTFNDDCLPPMEDSEVMDIAQSAWGYTERGQNRFGSHGAWMAFDEVASWGSEPDAFYLLAFLRAHHGPGNTFMVANGLAERFGWWRKRLAEARRRLIELEYLKPVRQAGRGHPALFRWRT